MASGYSNLRNIFPHSKLGVPYNPLSVNYNLDEETDSELAIENTVADYPLYYVSNGFMRFPVVDLEVQTKLEDVISSLKLRQVASVPEYSTSLGGTYTSTNCPRYVYFLAGILGDTVKYTIECLERHDMFTILVKRLVESKSDENKDCKRTFLDRFYNSDNDANFNFLDPLYDVVEGDEGLFVLGLFFLVVLSMSSGSSIPSIPKSISASNGISKRPWEVPIIPGEASNMIPREASNIAIKSNSKYEITNQEKILPIETTRPARSSNIPKLPTTPNTSTSISSALSTNAKSNSTTILSTSSTTKGLESNSPQIGSTLHIPTSSIAPDSSNDNINLSSNFPKIMPDGLISLVDNATRSTPQEPISKSPTTVFFSQTLMKFMIINGLIYHKKHVNLYEKIIGIDREYPLTDFPKSKSFLNAKRDLESDINKIRIKETTIKNGTQGSYQAPEPTHVTPQPNSANLTPEELSWCSRLNFNHTTPTYPISYINMFQHYNLFLGSKKTQILELVSNYNWPENEHFENVLTYFLSEPQFKWFKACISLQSMKESKLASLSDELHNKINEFKLQGLQVPTKEQVNDILRKCAIGYFRQYDEQYSPTLANFHEEALQYTSRASEIPEHPDSMVENVVFPEYSTAEHHFSSCPPSELDDIVHQLTGSVVKIKCQTKSECKKLWIKSAYGTDIIEVAIRALTEGRLQELFNAYRSKRDREAAKNEQNIFSNFPKYQPIAIKQEENRKNVSGNIHTLQHEISKTPSKTNMREKSPSTTKPKKEKSSSNTKAKKEKTPSISETKKDNETSKLSNKENDFSDQKDDDDISGDESDYTDASNTFSVLYEKHNSDSSNPYGALDDTDYSEYVYDELDTDEDFLELVDTLAGVFPTHPRTLLKIRIKTTDNIDELIEELCLEQESHDLMATLVEEQKELEEKKELEDQRTFSPKVYQLLDIFPTYDGEVLQEILDANYGDLELSTNSLLTGDHQERFQSTSKVRNAGPVEDDPWTPESTHNDVSKLAEITGIPVKEVTSYLQANEGRFVESLISIIYTYTPKPEPVTINTIDNQIPRGGRVQRGGKQPKRPQVRWGPRYKFDSKSDEAQELKTLYQSNPQLQELNQKFCEKALELFKGDVIKTIDLCRIVIEYDGASKTKVGPEVRKKGKKIVLSLEDTKDTERELVKRRADLRAQAEANAKARLRSRNSTSASSTPMLLSQRFEKYQSKLTSSNADDFQLQSERYQVYKRTGDLDLHSLRLTTALQVTRRALKEWWDEEIRLREQEGNLNRYGSEARFVDPIKVITGRGIHSTGGVSVIRRQVQYLLHTSNFIYTESVGHFVVRGHKK